MGVDVEGVEELSLEPGVVVEEPPNDAPPEVLPPVPLPPIELVPPEVPPLLPVVPLELPPEPAALPLPEPDGLVDGLVVLLDELEPGVAAVSRLLQALSESAATTATVATATWEREVFIRKLLGGF